MNRFIASKVACCDPVANSPDACVRPPGVSVANDTGMPPLALKKLVNAAPTLRWLTLRPGITPKSSAKLR
jgi:hypothetical protein